MEENNQINNQPNNPPITTPSKLDNQSDNKVSNDIVDQTIIDRSQEIKKKPIKELPIEKKPFKEFINEYLLPSIKNEFELRNKEISEINLKQTLRPISGDECWVIYCEVKNTCCFWLTFDNEDISSSKSFTLCRDNEEPSVLESFLIDERKITLNLIISRIFQRLNGQKLLGAN